MSGKLCYDVQSRGVPLTSGDAGYVLEDPTMYKNMAGSLIYVMISRPDLSYTVGLESQFMQVRCNPHLDCVRHTLRCLRATTNYALFYAAGLPFELYGYIDADWAGSI